MTTLPVASIPEMYALALLLLRLLTSDSCRDPDDAATGDARKASVGPAGGTEEVVGTAGAELFVVCGSVWFA